MSTIFQAFITRLTAQPLLSMLIGNILAQALIFTGISFFARVFSMEIMGLWSISQTWINILWSFSQLRTDMALFQAKEEQEQAGLFQTGLWAHLMITLLGLVVVVLVGIVPVFSIGMLSLVLLTMITFSLPQMALSWLASTHQFQYQNQLRLAVAIIGYPFALVLYFVLQDWALFTALLLSNVVPVIYFAQKGAIPFPYQLLRKKKLITLMRKHRKTSVILPLSNLLSIVSEHGLVLLIAGFYSGVQAAGCFMAMKICGIPLALIQSPVTQYNTRYFQDLWNQRQLRISHLWGNWLKWSLPALLFFVPVFWWGESFFALILGEKWLFSGQVASVLAIWAAVKFLNSSTSMIYFVMARHGILFVFTLILSLSLPLCFWLARNGSGILDILKIFTGFQIGVFLLYNIVMLAFIHKSEENSASRIHN